MTNALNPTPWAGSSLVYFSLILVLPSAALLYFRSQGPTRYFYTSQEKGFPLHCSPSSDTGTHTFQLIVLVEQKIRFHDIDESETLLSALFPSSTHPVFRRQAQLNQLWALCPQTNGWQTTLTAEWNGQESEHQVHFLLLFDLVKPDSGPDSGSWRNMCLFTSRQVFILCQFITVRNPLYVIWFEYWLVKL